MIRTTLLVCCILLGITVFAQKKKKAADPEKPGISVADFSPVVYTLDKSAHAVVLRESGKAEFKNNSSAWLDVVYTIHRRIRLLSPAGFNAGTLKISLRKFGSVKETLSSLEASTYNLENGVIKKTSIDADAMFSDEVTKNLTIKKITLPELKAGSIIDYTYVVKSPRVLTINSWSFSDEYPVLHSEYEVIKPSLFDFVYIPEGPLPLEPTFQDEFEDDFNLQSKIYSLTVSRTKWAVDNLLPIAPEPYTTTPANHMVRIGFQIRSINIPGKNPETILSSWPEFGQTMMKREDFGMELSGDAHWAKDEIRALKKEAAGKSLASAIFYFIRDHYTSVEEDGALPDDKIKKTFTSRNGNVADINLALALFLRKAGFTADPVLVSTRDNGYPSETYPIPERFNYLIVRAEVDGKELLLDASKKTNAFGRLPANLYNGSGRVVTEDPYLVRLDADSLLEAKRTSVFVSNAGKGKQTGSFETILGVDESTDARKEAGKNKAEFIKERRKLFPPDINITATVVDSLMLTEDPVAVKHEFEINYNEGLIYLNPMFGEGLDANPFKSAKRNYPVEMPYKINEVYSLQLPIPEGYIVDELPKSEKLTLFETEGLFEYLIESDGETIMLRSRLKIDKTYFPNEDYEALRGFFGHVAKKHAENIVFKKKK